MDRKRQLIRGHRGRGFEGTFTLLDALQTAVTPSFPSFLLPLLLLPLCVPLDSFVGVSLGHYLLCLDQPLNIIWLFAVLIG